MLLIFFFTVPLFLFFLISSTRAPKNTSVEPCLVSVVVLMRACSGTGEYEDGKEKITVYSLQKTRLHHWMIHNILCVCVCVCVCVCMCVCVCV